MTKNDDTKATATINEKHLTKKMRLLHGLSGLLYQIVIITMNA